MTANREFLKRLKTRDIVVLEGKDIKIAKVGYRGHKIVRKFVLDSVQDTNTVARAGIEERAEVNPIGMIITSMNLNYLK